MVEEWTRFDHPKFRAAAGRANQLTAALRADYPTLEPYLVVTWIGEFVDPKAALRTQWQQASGIFAEDRAKEDVFAHVRKRPPKKLHDWKRKKELKKWWANWEKDFDLLLGELRFSGDSLFEIRLGRLHYEEIWRMQADERVDTARTPQSRASIRIVLGTVVQFAAGEAECPL